MKRLVLALALVATPALAAAEAVMHRDPGCGCCTKWAVQVRKAFGQSVKIVDDNNRAALHNKIGLPSSLASCHTAFINGMAFEGHVPLAAMKRVLAARPKGVRGLAVAGMPIGSPGMEVPGVTPDRFPVMAYGNGKPFVYSRH